MPGMLLTLVPFRMLLAGSPRSDVDCRGHYCTYKNLWYNSGNWYVLVDGPIAGGVFKMSKHIHVSSIHVRSTRGWLRGVRWAVVPGETLILDFPYIGHPTAIGHWPEMLSPLFSILRNRTVHFGSKLRRAPDQMVLLHLRREHLFEWPRGLLAASLGVLPDMPLPPIFMQQFMADPQTGNNTGHLEGTKPDTWICFSRAVFVKDHMSGGHRTFASEEDARLLRDSMYARHRLKPPSRADRGSRPPPPVPKTITYIRKDRDRRVVNEAELLATLGRFGTVQTMEFNSTTPLREQLRVMSRTGLLVSSHSSQLANAQFLPPGSAVLELIHRNWLTPVDQSFKVQTAAMGDIHHYAWRCQDKSCVRYIDEAFGRLYGNFSAQECGSSKGCMDRHTNVDIVVDCAAISELLEKKLPRLWSPERPSVEEMSEPWPAAG